MSARAPGRLSMFHTGKSSVPRHQLKVAGGLELTLLLEGGDKRGVQLEVGGEQPGDFRVSQ
mgnify:CR=1 FL=1